MAVFLIAYHWFGKISPLFIEIGLIFVVFQEIDRKMIEKKASAHRYVSGVDRREWVGNLCGYRQVRR